MAAPSWLPTWPTNWPDIVDAYEAIIPRDWPRQLFRRDSQAYADNEAFGESLSMVRQLLEWILRHVMPQNDSNALFIDRWESTFNLYPAEALADRVSALEGKWRHRGTTTKSMVTAMMVGQYGPGTVYFVRAEVDDVVTSETRGSVTYAEAFYQLGVIHTNADSDGYAAGEKLMDLIQPHGETWWVGSITTSTEGFGLWDDSEAVYDHCAWG
jgi:hypothetical protein